MDNLRSSTDDNNSNAASDSPNLEGPVAEVTGRLEELDLISIPTIPSNSTDPTISANMEQSHISEEKHESTDKEVGSSTLPPNELTDLSKYKPEPNELENDCFNELSLMLGEKKIDIECGNHHTFVPFAIRCLNMCRKYLCDNQVFAPQHIINFPNEQTKVVLDATCCILENLSNIFELLKSSPASISPASSSVSAGPSSVLPTNSAMTITSSSSLATNSGPALNYPKDTASISTNATTATSLTDIESSDFQASFQTDWIDDGPHFNSCDDDDESLGDDSDNELLSNKLCTFTVTKKDFLNQHWYHCHTCNLIDVVGVCTVCAKVCHKNHDISYVKFGAFFCDCAGKENSTCQALVKRPRNSSSIDANVTGQPSEDNAERNIDHRMDISKVNDLFKSAEPVINDENVKSESSQFSVQRSEPFRDSLLEILSNSQLCEIIANLLNYIIPAYSKFAQNLQRNSIKRKKTYTNGVKNNENANSKPTFPVDFFENLQIMSDVDFGGPDVLSIYSVEQLRNRLNTTGMQITNVKPGGFSIEVINSDPNMVICGLRVQVGHQDLSKAPSSIEVFGRNLQISPLTCRWYDIPLTREESILTERRLVINFGPSSDPNGVTRVDSIKVYGKTKDTFSWPEESDKNLNSSITNSDEIIDTFLSQEPGSRCQNLLIHSLDILECCIVFTKDQGWSREKQEELAKELSTSLLIAPYSQSVLKAIKSLLIVIYGSRQNYLIHRESTAMEFVMSGLNSLNDNQIDCELYSRVVNITKSLSLSKQSNLNKLSDYLYLITQKVKSSPSSSSLNPNHSKTENLILFLVELFERLYLCKTYPDATEIQTTSHTRTTDSNFTDSLQPLIELVYIVTLYDNSILEVTIDILIKFLLNKNLEIALCTRNGLARLLRTKIYNHSQSPYQITQTNSGSETNLIEADRKSSIVDSSLVRQLHLSILQKLIQQLPHTRDAGGYRSMSLLHVILLLVLELDSASNFDEDILKQLLTDLRQELLHKTEDHGFVSKMNSINEVKLVIMRMFSVMLSKVRTSTAASTLPSSSKSDNDNMWSIFCASTTAQCLIDLNIVDFCFLITKIMLNHWKECSDDIHMTGAANFGENPTTPKKSLAKSSPEYQLLETSHFFWRSSIKGKIPPIFDEYHYYMTEMALRIPYQLKKVSCLSSNGVKPITFENAWTSLLCDYLMIPTPPLIKKNVIKLLTSICGSKDKYRQFRDFHFLESHIETIKLICGPRDDELEFYRDDRDRGMDFTRSLSYESSTVLVDHLKSCISIAQTRCINWQTFCLFKDQQILRLLTEMSIQFCDDIATIIVELIQLALSPVVMSTNHSTDTLIDAPVITANHGSEINGVEILRDSPESLSSSLSQQLITQLPKESLVKFIQNLMFETNQSSLRWQAHSLLCTLWSNFNSLQQIDFLNILWSQWSNLPRFGRKAAQFVDLIGFVTLKSPHHDPVQRKMFCDETMSVLSQQNRLLMNHPNAHIYSSIQGLVDLDCYYLENEPCCVCNSPEIPYNNVKLSSIKIDSRFTTTTQIIKLNGSHTILKFNLRISDIKRSKMVKTISVHYNNRSIQSVVELKNKTGIWHLARRYPLSPSQTEVKIEFTLPIVACNLMIEFSEFYDSPSGPSETLLCPRCSTSVSANPGVCGNCGENVFQCHKCRAINYDEKDPFLCTSCGFCKYARFDITLTTKPTCAVDPIENEEDRKKAVASIGNLLDKADRVYKILVANKPALELLLLRTNDQIISDNQFESIVNSLPTGSSSGTNQSSGQPLVVGHNYSNYSNQSSVNKIIQLLAQKYCVECKSLFEDLSKTTHMILAYRKEIVEYDNKQLRRCVNASSSLLTHSERRKSKVYSSLTSGSGKCYGCASATVEHCLTIMKALATIDPLRAQLCDDGIVSELVSYNLRVSYRSMSKETRELLCLLTKGDIKSTTIMTKMLMDKIIAISQQEHQPAEILHTVRHELALLALTLESDDQCWEMRLKCLIIIFALSFEMDNPVIMKSLLIPCLKIILSIIRPQNSVTRRHKDKSLDVIASVRSDKFRNSLNLKDWLDNSSPIFENWRKRGLRPSRTSMNDESVVSNDSSSEKGTCNQARANYLAEVYGNKWRLRASRINHTHDAIINMPNNWLKKILFNQSSRTVRMMAKSIMEALFAVDSQRQDIIDLLTSYLVEIGKAGECAQEFFIVYRNMIMTDHWRYYLTLRGILLKLGDLITQEIDHLQHLEDTTFNSSLALGCSLRMYVELLTSFVSVPKIRENYKSKLVGFVLKGYLSLRKLVVQRTKVIDETQEVMLEMLEGMTTGSEEETANFIRICVDAIKNCSEGDIRTPVYIFERLCSTIHPEETSNNDFFICLEKDPQQEDFLHGRMVGNPYSSNEPGFGPLMKDIKNKICRDCELLALLEDDSSMELLVANKIISLDLNVRDVYKRVWAVENHENDAMRIVYRMRGLLGDATEEFIDSLNTHTNEDIDEERDFKMANVMSTCGGLEVMLDRLKQIDDLPPPLKPLLNVILRLLSFCTKTRQNRQTFIEPDLKTIKTLLGTLKLALNEDDFLEATGLPKGFMYLDIEFKDVMQKPAHASSSPQIRCNVVDQILDIMDTILKEATRQSADVYQQFCYETCGSMEDLQLLLRVAFDLSIKMTPISHRIIQMVPFLTLGIDDKMNVLIGYFKQHIDFDRFDQEHSQLKEIKLDLLCCMLDAIEHNHNGNQLKDYIVSEGFVAKSLDYLVRHAPPLHSSLLATSDEWGNFTQKPSLKYVLRILTGLSRGHPTSQLLISRDCIHIMHGLEQVSSDTHVGTLAENLLEAIKQHPAVAERIELVRRQTREEKKRLAMLVRERQLVALGMRANERGQVIAKSKLLEQCQDLAEDSGLVCNICREGYNFQPTRVLGIYTYTKRCILDEFELKRKSYGYTTVTHFNTVHVECHMSAVRSARGREEWDSAALQNANTRCNGLLPIWGPQVVELAYANALARHNSYLQDSTGCRDIGYRYTIHDIRLQLLRFAQERSFSEDTGGGGAQSNMHLLTYMMQTALYVLNSTKANTREYKRTLNHLEICSSEVLENCYEVESPYYWTVLALLVLSPSRWKKKRALFLQRLIICKHVRRVGIKPPASLSGTRARSYPYYKSAFIFFAIIDGFYNIVFKDAIMGDRWDQEWSMTLADFIRHNDQTVNDNIEILLNLYQNSLLPCSSIERFFEIIPMEEVSNPSDFLANTLEIV